MKYRVTIAVDSLDPNPEVTEFEDFYEAEDFIHDSVDQSVQSLMSQSPYIISEKEYEQLLEQEMALTRLDVI
jgi:hypothetical protein|tara:strand:- start:601 stop:816 length:216 start_codon:yes stop_codon:yes gene_type:complete